MTEVNVSATVGMSATVGEMSAKVDLGNIRNSRGNVCNSGKIEYDLRYLTVEMGIHTCA